MRKILSCGSIYIVFILLAMLILGNKENLYIDEVFSYGLANTTGNITRMEFEPGVTYTPASAPFLDYMTVDSAHRFDYKQVHYIQGFDCHPPFYYYLLHTICSFFPGTFSIWYAGVLNIVFAVFNLMVVKKLLENLCGTGMKTQIISWGYALSAGILHTVSFLRMYVLAMLWVTLLTYLFVRCIDRKMEKKDYVLIFVTSVLSAHTHYYCILYLILLCAVFAIVLLYLKRGKELFDFILTMCLAAVTSIFIFEPIIDHMFGSHVGKLTADNYSSFSLSEYMKRLDYFETCINNQMFGGLLGLLLIAGLVLTISMAVKSRLKKESRDREPRMVSKWLLLILPSICYWLVVVKLAIFDEDRYMFPIYAVVFIVVMAWVLEGLMHFFTKKVGMIAGIVSMAIISVNGWRTCEWTYLYKNTVPFLQEAAKYSEVDAILVYETDWEPQYSFYECLNYKSVTFISSKEINLLEEVACRENDELIVMFSGDVESIVPDVMRYCPNVDAYEVLDKEGQIISTCYLSRSNSSR